MITGADKALSKLVRAQAARLAFGEWIAECFTCEKTYPINKLQAGHYIVRTVWSQRYNPLNVWPQCTQCNLGNEGNKIEFQKKLKPIFIEKYIETHPKGIGKINAESAWKIFDDYRGKSEFRPQMMAIGEKVLAHQFNTELKKLFALNPGLENAFKRKSQTCLLYTSPSPRDRTRSRMPSSA